MVACRPIGDPPDGGVRLGLLFGNGAAIMNSTSEAGDTFEAQEMGCLYFSYISS